MKSRSFQKDAACDTGNVDQPHNRSDRLSHHTLPAEAHDEPQRQNPLPFLSRFSLRGLETGGKTVPQQKDSLQGNRYGLTGGPIPLGKPAQALRGY